MMTVFMFMLLLALVGYYLSQTQYLHMDKAHLNETGKRDLTYVHVSDIHGKTSFINGLWQIS